MRLPFCLIVLCLIIGPGRAQTNYPQQIDGYKLERAKVEVRKDGDMAADADVVVKIGEPRLVRVTPLGVTFELPLTVNPVKQGGRVDFLRFADVEVNNTEVTIDEYLKAFDLPGKKPLLLKNPVRVFVSAPGAVANVVGNIWRTEETWLVKGRVYVFGRFKKFLFKFKRVVPVEFVLTIPNPLKLNRDKATDNGK